MRRVRRVALLLGLLGAAWSGPAEAQHASDVPLAGVANPGPRISLITFGAGHNSWKVWELFGHNMIRVTDPGSGTDVAYNFGMFDFGQENFYWNFLQGRMWYWMEPDNPVAWIAGYQRVGRSVEIQELDMTPAQALALAEALARNAQPDQMFYRYEPFRDNCSTRVRDALNLALGGALERELSAVPSGATFRSRTAELTAANPAIYFGLMLLLGPSTDQPLSAWDDAFIPMRFAHYLEPVQSPAVGDGTTPLVAFASFQPAPDAASSPPRSPARWLGWFLVFGVLMGGLLAWTGGRSGAGRGRRPFLALAGAWTLLSGLAGLIMVYLWALTDHSYAFRNENVLQASALGLVMFGVLAVWARRDGPAPAGLRVLAATVAALSVAGVVIQVLPWFPQVNAPILAFFVPANLGMALGARRAAPASATTPVPTAIPS